MCLFECSNDTPQFLGLISVEPIATSREMAREGRSETSIRVTFGIPKLLGVDPKLGSQPFPYVFGF